MKTTLMACLLLWSALCSAAEASHIPTTPTAVKFLAMCSSVSGSAPLEVLVSYANCIGRVGGYAKGHTMTVELQNLTSRKQSAHPVVQQLLWCIPKAGISDQQLFDSVLAWAESHQPEFKLLANKYDGETGAYAVITRALHSQYKCN